MAVFLGGEAFVGDVPPDASDFSFGAGDSRADTPEVDFSCSCAWGFVQQVRI